MRCTLLSIVVLAAGLVGGAALAEESGAPAAPSGAPAAAAEHGSSMAGEAGAKEEMSSHDGNVAKQKTMSDPHKQSK